ncbi:MAG: hypothetical protein WCC86_05900 [Methanoregula sp.]
MMVGAGTTVIMVVVGTTGVPGGILFGVLVHPENKITIIQIKIRKKLIFFISILLSRRELIVSASLWIATAGLKKFVFSGAADGENRSC